MIVAYSDDLKDVFLEMGHQMHQESRFRIYNFSEEKLLKLIKHPKIQLNLAYSGEEPVGFFLGGVQTMLFSEDLAGFDIALYIKPEYRGGMHAVRLVKEFEKFCKEQGCVTINLNAGAEIANDSAERLYTKLGYKKYGIMTHKEL